MYQEASIQIAEFLNPGPSLAAFQVPKYTEDNLQQIFKVVLEVRPPIAYGQDQETFEDPLE